MMCSYSDHKQNTTEDLLPPWNVFNLQELPLNESKCEFNKEQIKFLGHIIDGEGVHADPAKTAAVREMKVPQNITEVQRFLGMVNQLGSFSQRLADLSQPLRELLSTKRAWTWGSDQEQAFTNIKTELSADTVLVLYNPKAKTKVSTDASSHGLGAVLLQQEKSRWRPVTYASRTLTETEQRYSQIEKEALAAAWACDKFSDYLLGLHFTIESDHKPLIPLLGTKRLDSLPPRVLRFRLQLDRFQYMIVHVPGKHLYIADTLSRAPLQSSDSTCSLLLEEVEAFAEGITSSHPASEKRLKEYRSAQIQELLPFWHERSSISVANDLLLHGSRIVVPPSLRADTLKHIHEGHQGIVRCQLRMRMSVWWPGISSEVANMVEQCRECSKNASPRREPLLCSPVPEYPWQMVGSDLFTLNGDQYLLVADYFSRYPKVVKLNSTTSQSIITQLRSIFARHGIPETL